MNKKMLTIALAFGCVASNATTNNYDVLGRKGSKMNSPMVYKNVDYSIKSKNKQLKTNSSLENQALHRNGLDPNVAAIEGGFKSYASNNNFYLKRYYYSGVENCNYSLCLHNWNTYKSALNTVFINTNEEIDVNPGRATNATEILTHAEDNGGYTVTYVPSNFNIEPLTINTLPSPFVAGQNISYISFPVLKVDYALSSVSSVEIDNVPRVGIYMGADALPIALYSKNNPQHYKAWLGDYNDWVVYYRYDENEHFNPAPGYEMRDSWVYFYLKYSAKEYYKETPYGNGFIITSSRPLVFVGKKIDYGNPALKSPQIYIGVRNNTMSKGPINKYSSSAKELDNFIYKYRTVEFVPAGNYGADGTNTQGAISSMGQASNAITVGSVDPLSGKITNYTSTRNHNLGTIKPEIFDYSHTYLLAPKRIYKSNSTGHESVFESVSYGTEMSAAHMAGLVSNFLALNPFYRWHPEVVKAFLLTAEGNPITPPYPTNSAMNAVPTARYFDFNKEKPNAYYDFDSRYWNGSLEDLKTRTNHNGQKEIWFVTKNLGSVSKPATAAISWLSSGNDIDYIGRIPQDFDLEVYGSNNSTYEKYITSHAKLSNIDFDNPGEYIGGSNCSHFTFEKVSIPSNHKYLIFRILLYSEDERSENKGQVVMGFNIASPQK